MVGCPWGSGAAAIVCGWHLHQPGPWAQAGLPLLWAAALRPGRVEDPSAQRSARSGGGVRPVGGLRRRRWAQRYLLARSAFDGPAAGTPRWGSRALPLGRTVVVSGASAAAERSASGAP